jgi:hypothetical protein
MFNYMSAPPADPSRLLRQKILADTAVDPEAPGHREAQFLVICLIGMMCTGQHDQTEELMRKWHLREPTDPVAFQWMTGGAA